MQVTVHIVVIIETLIILDIMQVAEVVPIKVGIIEIRQRTIITEKESREPLIV